MAMGINKVILIGRLTADPECRTFSTGGKVAKMRFAVTNRKKNAQSGQWEDDPMYIDIDAFNYGQTGTLANIVEQYCRKGSQICVEGRLVLDTWDDKASGQKRSKHKIVAEQIQLLDSRGGQGGAGGGRAGANGAMNEPAGYGSGHDEMHDQPAAAGSSGDDIPF